MLPPCLGRRDLITRARRDLAVDRLVSLVGPQGVGKTLLARHTVAGRGSVAWVTVAPGSTIEDIVADSLAVLDPDTAPGDTASFALKRALDDGEHVLVLDGLDESSPRALDELVTSLLATTSDARFVLTTTRPLATGGAQLRVPPLPVPRAGQPLDGPAVELFVSRLAAAGGDLVDLDRDERVVRALLDASGGLPLLIEQFAVQAALAGLDAVVPEDTLGGVVAASYAMVNPLSQKAYRLIGVLPAPVGVDVVAHLLDTRRAVAIGAVALLERHGLVELGSDERVGMLAPVRLHARELARASGEVALAEDGLIRWADATLPASDQDGSGDEPWLADLDIVYAAVRAACARPDLAGLGYHLANRAFSALYVAMKPREALALFELALDSGPGPSQIGAQVARRAGICASEVRGTFEGLRFLDLAEEPARRASDPDVQLARTASIRAEVYLDAGQLERARAEAASILESGVQDSYVLRQAARTLMDVEVSEGNLDAAQSLSARIVDGPPPAEERWLAIAARILCGQIAWEEGRELEAAAIARGAREEALGLAEDRIALLADVLHRRVTGAPAVLEPQPESLPWAIRLGYQLQHARDVLASGEPMRAAGLAADIVVLADSARLERDGVEARIVLGDALLAAGDDAQARTSYAAAVRHASACPMPLRVADALDGLAAALIGRGPDTPRTATSHPNTAHPSTGRTNTGQPNTGKPNTGQPNTGHPNIGRAGRFTGAANALRAHLGAARRPRPGFDESRLPPPRSAGSWVAAGALTESGIKEAGRLEDGTGEEAAASGLAATLTKAQLAVAELVGRGLTSKEIAETLFLSPRTVDNHLFQIYRRLDITSRAKLAALMADAG